MKSEKSSVCGGVHTVSENSVVRVKRVLTRIQLLGAN